MQRSSGVLMHISSLFGPYSCGSFGANAKYFIDFLKDCGFAYWQVLPFCIPDECNSPYKSYSAFSGNPYFIDLDLLYQKGLLTKAELAAAEQKTPYSCEFERLEQERLPLLLSAARRAQNKAEIEAFITRRPQIERACTFLMHKAVNGDKEWPQWTNHTTDGEILFMWKFIHYTFLQQWEEIHAYAAEKGIKIIGDIPIYVAYDSADVWANRAQFLLDQDYAPGAVAGVPPDYFSAEGQLWGNPLYNWAYMATDGYRWWMERLGHMLTLFDGVRIDHFRGLESFWSVPADAKTAKAGHWVPGPGKAFIDKIKAAFPDKLIIAEDLGDITPEVEELVEYSGFPGMRVLQFGFLNGEDSPHRPHNYIKNCVAYTGTHDNNTLLGYVWELDDAPRKMLLEYCGYTHPDWDKGYNNILRTMLLSRANLVIFPIQDLLFYGADTRLNIPGKAKGNWSYRITKDQLDSIDRTKFYKLNRLYGR